MPITGPASYLPTTTLFLAHWEAANAALGHAGPIVLGGGITRADLSNLRDALEAQRIGVERARNSLEGARADIELNKAALLNRLNQFNGKLTSLAANTRWEPMLPRAFSITEGMGRVLPPLDDMQDLWTRYEAQNAAIALMGDYSLAQFDADLLALRAAYKAYSSAEMELGLARGLRNETQAKIHPVLKAYRQRIPSEFAEGSSIFATLPRLSPPAGSTPDAVILSGAYEPESQSATLTWTEVTDDSVTKLELRSSVGTSYDAEDEAVLATFAPSDARNWTGTYGLGVPGATVNHKLYSITAEGNERGSNAVAITRPVG